MKAPRTKRCAKCKRAKKASAFYKGQWTNGSWCKVCYRDDYVNRRDEIRSKRILRSYGLSREDYQRLLETQGGVCAICKKLEQNKHYKFLAVDHDHVTGKVRGLLCHRCNAGLGNFNDAIGLLREAVAYLCKHSEKAGIPLVSASVAVETSPQELS